MDTALKVTINKNDDGIFVVTPVGVIDSITYVELEKKLEAILVPTTKTIVFSMGRVSYISSMGVNIIFKTRNFLEKQNGSMIMVDLQPHVKTVFDILKALHGMKVFANVEELDAYLAAMQRKRGGAL